MSDQLHHILVVDDHPDSARVVCTLLGLLGYASVGATSGSEALAQARIHEFDIAIVDIGLPDISGHEVARELRRLPSGRSIYLAAISGWGSSEDRVRALDAGFDHHALKPIDVGILKRIVALAERRSGTPARATSER